MPFETCEDRDYRCCDLFPPSRPIIELSTDDTDSYYTWHVAQFKKTQED